MKAAFLSVLLLGILTGCATRSAVQPNFSAAYQLVAARGHAPLAAETTVYLFDDALNLTAVARRDQRSVGIGGYDQMQDCQAGDYCVEFAEVPGPLVVFSEPRTSLSIDGWQYETERRVPSLDTCDRFTARHPAKAEWFTYTWCEGLGISSIITHDGPTLVMGLQLRSYLGLGSTSPR
jgi:hypothetical protein